MKTRKEKLRVFHRNDDKQAPWVFRFREQINEDGVLKTVHRSMTLCPASVKRADAFKLAEKESARLAQTRPTAPEMMVTLADYFTRVYLPFAKSKLRFATAHNYGTMWGKHFASRPHITRKLLCDVRTSDVYAWLGEIVATDKTESGDPIFRTANGTPIDPNNILRDRMQPAFKKAGIAFLAGLARATPGPCQ